MTDCNFVLILIFFFSHYISNRQCIVKLYILILIDWKNVYGTSNTSLARIYIRFAVITLKVCLHEKSRALPLGISKAFFNKKGT